MRKRIISKTSAFIAVLLCFLTVFSSAATAVESSPEALSVESIAMPSQCGIVEGKSVQLTATLSPENALISSVIWSSSNPDVISCTSGGKITGKKAGGFAYITCKSVLGNVSKSIKVYCAEPIGSYVKSGFTNFITFVYKQPGNGNGMIHVNSQMLQLILTIMSMFMSTNSVPMTSNAYIFNSLFLMSAKCEVRGKYGKYAYVVFNNDNGYVDGFVNYSSLTNTGSGNFLEISAKDMDVWSNGYKNPDKKLTVNYDGDVKWTVEGTDIIDFNEETGQVIGKKPGIATITATADGMTETCTVHSLYRWIQKDGAATESRKRDWKTQTRKKTPKNNEETEELEDVVYLYSAKGNEYVQTKYLGEGVSFTVCGDSGQNDHWAYGYVTGTNLWGYIPIENVSTKGTVSQYRHMNWLWPVKTPAGKNKANYISSPFGWRILNSELNKHKGMDITTGTSGEIKGYEVVSAFAGEVVYISNDPTSDTGYCVAVRLEEKDPVTEEYVKDPVSNNYIVAIYMHLNQAPSVDLNQNVSKGEILGYVGNTGSTSTGYHLHFEANNKNASVNSAERKNYNNLINPIFFYLDPDNNSIIGDSDDKKGNDDKIIINSGSSAVSDYNGAYWYGDESEDNK